MIVAVDVHSYNVKLSCLVWRNIN